MLRHCSSFDEGRLASTQLSTYHWRDGDGGRNDVAVLAGFRWFGGSSRRPCGARDLRGCSLLSGLCVYRIRRESMLGVGLEVVVDVFSIWDVGCSGSLEQ